MEVRPGLLGSVVDIAPSGRGAKGEMEPPESGAGREEATRSRVNTMRGLRQWLKRGIRKNRDFVQRGKRGWSPSDTWNLDHYWAGVMGASLAHLASIGMSWPGEGSEWKSEQEWSNELHQHALVLSAYSTDWEGKVEIAPTLHRLADIWGQLWD